MLTTIQGKILLKDFVLNELWRDECELQFESGTVQLGMRPTDDMISPINPEFDIYGTVLAGSIKIKPETFKRIQREWEQPRVTTWERLKSWFVSKK